jgi:hypothetical protein
VSELFELFKPDYRLGNCSVRVYDRRVTDIWGTNFLHQLYTRCLASAPSREYGILDTTFCGMADTSADAICAYLHTRSPLLIMCADKTDKEFDVIGFSFPTIWAGIMPGAYCSFPIQRSMFMGYGAFRQWWGTPELTICMMLTGIYYFHVYEPLVILGQRYRFNHLTARFLSQFGTHDVGTIPKLLLLNGKLEDCTISAIDRDTFENYVRKTLISITPNQT